jgi:hypothetical protein
MVSSSVEQGAQGWEEGLEMAGPVDRELQSIREEMHRNEDRMEARLNRMDRDTIAWRDRLSATVENQHFDNLKRFETLEKAFNQGIGVMVAMRAGWGVLIAFGGIIAGYLGHKFGN